MKGGHTLKYEFAQALIWSVLLALVLGLGVSFIVITMI